MPTVDVSTTNRRSRGRPGTDTARPGPPETAFGGRVQFLQRDDVGVGGQQRPDRTVHIGVVGVDVVRQHPQLAVTVGLVGQQPRERRQPEHQWQRGGDQRRRRSAQERPRRQWNDRPTEPGKERLDETSQVSHRVGNEPMQCQNGGHHHGQSGGDQPSPPHSLTHRHYRHRSPQSPFALTGCNGRRGMHVSGKSGVSPRLGAPRIPT